TRRRYCRIDTWTKTPCKRREAFAIIGWAEKGTRFDGFYLGEERDGKLVYAGKIEGGWTEEQKADPLARRRLLSVPPGTVMVFTCGRNPKLSDSAPLLPPRIESIPRRPSPACSRLDLTAPLICSPAILAESMSLPGLSCPTYPADTLPAFTLAPAA